MNILVGSGKKRRGENEALKKNLIIPTRAKKCGELRRRENSTIRKDDWNRDKRAIKIFPTSLPSDRNFSSYFIN